MIGVVVWSNRSRQQAVIWCEDHAALAYLAGEEHCAASQEWPEPGDMVELETEVVGDLRCARKVRPLTEQRLSLLPELLRRGTAERAAAPRHLKVVASGPGRAAVPASASEPVRDRGLGRGLNLAIA